MHNLTKINGLMLHDLPFEGYVNHGYFNYQPKFFYDLAIFNNYEIIGFWYFAQRTNKLFKYYGFNYKSLKYNDNLMDELDKLAEDGKMPYTPKTNHSSLTIIYKKLKDNPFVLPFQGEWLNQSKIKKYKEFVSEERLKKIIETNKNVNNKKQIEEKLGGGYWKNKLKNSFKDYKYLIKNIKLLLNLIGFKFTFKKEKYWDRK